MFLMAAGTTEIAPGETVTYEDTLSSDAFDAIRDRVYTMQAYIIGSSEDFDIDENGYTAYYDGSLSVSN
jgi:hypothetical protein